MTSEVIGRRLNELNTSDLKNELAKRKLDIFGSRNDLIEKLKNALTEEGINAEKFLFILSDKSKDRVLNYSQANKLPDVIGTDIKTEILDIEDIASVDGDNDIEEQMDPSAYNFQFYLEDNEESMSLNNGEDVQSILNEEEDEDDKGKVKKITKESDIGDKETFESKKESKNETKRENFLTKIVSNKRQMTRLVELMKENVDIARGTMCRANAKKKWEEFVVELNSLGPPKRNSEKWQRVWSDLKSKVKKTLNYNKEETARGDGLSMCYQFSKMEEEVINILQLNAWMNPSGEIFGIGSKNTTKPSTTEELENVTDLNYIANSTESVNDEPETEGEAEPKKEIIKVVSNKRQMVRLVELMEQNLDIGRGIILKASAKKKWEEFAVELNSLGPPERDCEKWQRVWSDLKTKLRKKINDNKEKIKTNSGESSKCHQFSEIEQAVINILQLNPWPNSTEETPNGDQNTQINSGDITEKIPQSNNFNVINTETANGNPGHLPENLKMEAQRRRKKQITQTDKRLYLLKQQTDLQKEYQGSMVSIMKNIRNDLHSIEECIRENYYENRKYKKRKLELKQKKLDLLEQEIKNKEKYRKSLEIYRKTKLELKTQMLARTKNFSLDQHDM